jgi:hypothetical protein
MANVQCETSAAATAEGAEGEGSAAAATAEGAEGEGSAAAAAVEGAEGEGSAEGVLCLFNLVNGDGLHSFVELKRPALEDCGDISRFVSWFWCLTDGMPGVGAPITPPNRLSFESWDGLVRTFSQGVLKLESEDGALAHFAQPGEDGVNLAAYGTATVSPQLVAACVKVWGD